MATSRFVFFFFFKMADSVSLDLKMAASACQTVPVRPDWRTMAGEEGIICF